MENHVCTADQILEGGFLTKVSSLKPKPSFLYLEAQIDGKHVSCLVDTGATHSFMSPKLTKELDLTTRRADKPIDIWFAKDKLHETKELTLYVILKCLKL